MSAAFHALEIAEVRRETKDAISLSFRLPDDLREAFRFTPGQHLTLRTEIGGEDVRRNYSLCNAPHDDELRVAIKQVSGGVFSTWANAQLKTGDLIEVMPPHGSFTWTFQRDRQATYAGFAGGSGITPILSLLKTALIAEPDSNFILLYGNRSSDSIMFLEEIAALKDRFMGRFQVYHFLSDEHEDIDLFNGMLDADKVKEILCTLIDPTELDLAFVCGPAPMMDAAQAMLGEMGVPANRILLERFTVGSLSETEERVVRMLEQQADGLTTQIKLDGRRRTLAYHAAKGSILENVRAAGISAPFACKAGVCATCRAKLVSGKVHMIVNYGLSAEEIAQGYVLTCQAVPITDDVMLDYDA